jgi:hypothetical protein
MTKAKRLLLHLLLGLSTGNAQAQGPDQQGKATQQHFSFLPFSYMFL